MKAFFLRLKTSRQLPQQPRYVTSYLEAKKGRNPINRRFWWTTLCLSVCLVVVYTCWVPPRQRFCLRMPCLSPTVLHRPWQAFWRDGFDSFPWAGKAFFLASSLGSVLMTRWQGLFLDEGDGPRGTWYDCDDGVVRREKTAVCVFLCLQE